MRDLSDTERANVERTIKHHQEFARWGHTLNMEFAHLSTRTQNALKNEGINTEAELRDYWTAFGESGFLRIPNFGRKSLREIIEAYDLPDLDARKHQLFLAADALYLAAHVARRELLALGVSEDSPAIRQIDAAIANAKVAQ